MNDSSSNDPRYQQPVDVTRQVAADDWNRAEIESLPENPPRRERIFPRKVLVGWALFALALYFGVRVVGTVIKESFRGAISTAVDNTGQKEIIYKTRNGKVTITRDQPTGGIRITTGDGQGRPSKTVEIPGSAATIPPPPKPPTTITVNGDGVTVTHPPAAAPAPPPTKR
jgi:hypothetical protein